MSPSRRITASFHFGLLFLFISFGSTVAQQVTADLVLKNGKIWTVDPQLPECKPLLFGEIASFSSAKMKKLPR